MRSLNVASSFGTLRRIMSNDSNAAQTFAIRSSRYMASVYGLDYPASSVEYFAVVVSHGPITLGPPSSARLKYMLWRVDRGQIRAACDQRE